MLIRVTVRRLLLCLLAAATVAPAAEPDDPMLGQRLRAHVDFLADDLLRGRQAGSDGYDIAANYVSSQYRQMGLAPAGANGRYLQPVPLRSARLVDGSAAMSVSRDGRSTPLRFLDAFFIPPNLVHTVSDITAPMVFAGYGIEAPELAYDDYADIDVRGKIVVFLAGQPPAFSNVEGMHFGSIRERGAAAARHGALGMVIIHTPRADQRVPWQRFRDLAGMPAMDWLDKEGEPHRAVEGLQAVAYVHYDAAEVLFDETPRDLRGLLVLDERGEPLPVFELYGSLSLRQRSRHEVVFSPNVVAVLKGRDPRLADEYVLFTAHLDHLGEAPPAGGGAGSDRIYNGALDNAIGVAVMLETARAFSRGPAPRRSLLFVAVTAEEKGLVGSDYFANNPSVPAGAIAADVNVDMPMLLYDFGDVIAYGSEHSSLGNAVAQAARESGVAVTPDPFPEQNLFIRSDHYSFVQQGIPSVFLVAGVTRRGGGPDSRAVYDDFLKQHYHQPSDQPDLPIDYGAAARFTRIIGRVGEIIADQDERPHWRQGDFFGRIQPSQQPVGN